MQEQILRVEHLRVDYGQVQALEDMTLSIPKGVRAAVVGPNGAGKSTFFKAILGLEKATQGQVTLFGQSNQLEQIIKDKVAYIPQASQVNWNFPATVYDIVMMGRFAHITGLFKRPRALDRQKVEEALETMRLTDLKDRQIDQLSGGQRQRVFIARALVQEADLYLMDEPLAGVDIETEKIIMATLKTFQEQGKTSIVIHHDLTTVSSYFDYMVWLNRRAVAAGPLKEVMTEANYLATYRVQDVSLLFGKEG
ncbi:metal ABC transporter ATP-binding protein [Streptococcus caprae]|uniref:Metal ABC transporter ATP-binding protein n=1 Tax=Streptococcus caprae TaxID=1640501 RepID=A0ABV8CW39_9STRE